MIAALSMLAVVAAASVGYAVHIYLERRREARRLAHIRSIARMYRDAHELD